MTKRSAGRSLIALTLTSMLACEVQTNLADATAGNGGEGNEAGASAGGSGRSASQGGVENNGGSRVGGRGGADAAGSAGTSPGGAGSSFSGAGAGGAGAGSGGVGGTAGDHSPGGAGAGPEDCWDTLESFCRDNPCPATLDEGLSYVEERVCEHGAALRQDGCGLTAISNYPGLGGMEFVYDATTGNLVGAVIYGDIGFGPCGSASYQAGVDFETCAEPSRCEICPYPDGENGYDDPACDGGEGGSGPTTNCVRGCEPEPAYACGEAQLTWVCNGSFDHQVFLDAGCSDPGTGVQRFCCEPNVLQECSEICDCDGIGDEPPDACIDASNCLCYCASLAE